MISNCNALKAMENAGEMEPYKYSIKGDLIEKK